MWRERDAGLACRRHAKMDVQGGIKQRLLAATEMKGRSVAILQVNISVMAMLPSSVSSQCSVSRLRDLPPTLRHLAGTGA